MRWLVIQLVFLVTLGLVAGWIHHGAADTERARVEATARRALERAIQDSRTASGAATTPGDEPDVVLPRPNVTSEPAAPEPAAAPTGESTAEPSDANVGASTGETDTLGDEITVAQARALFEAGGAYFIDARKPELYEQGHVVGAMSIPPAAFLAGDGPVHLRMGVLDPEDPTPIVIYCTGGDCDDSHHVLDDLRMRGFQNLHIMVDGYPGWTEAGLPTEQGPDPYLELDEG